MHSLNSSLCSSFLHNLYIFFGSWGRLRSISLFNNTKEREGRIINTFPCCSTLTANLTSGSLMLSMHHHCVQYFVILNHWNESGPISHYGGEVVCAWVAGMLEQALASGGSPKTSPSQPHLNKQTIYRFATVVVPYSCP